MRKDKPNTLLVVSIVVLTTFIAMQVYEYINKSGGSLADSETLSELVVVDGNLEFSGRLEHIHGLYNLAKVNGSLDLSENNLQSIDGLRSLTSVNGSIDLSGNNFTNVDALKEFTHLAGSIDLRDNPNLVDLRGLKDLFEFNGTIYVDPGIHERRGYLGITGDSMLCVKESPYSIEGIRKDELCESTTPIPQGRGL